MQARIRACQRKQFEKVNSIVSRKTVTNEETVSIHKCPIISVQGIDKREESSSLGNSSILITCFIICKGRQTTLHKKLRREAKPTVFLRSRYKPIKQKNEKTATGYYRHVTIYECEDCSNCPYKKDCIKGNNCKTAFENRKKILYVSRKMEEKRAECLERITSEYGTQLRMNRSIQAEGSFANVKEDMNFRRYMYRGKSNVLAQSILLAIGYDINNLHHKIMSERTGTHLFKLKKAS